MYSPSSGLYSCPLAMTDGAAKTAESLGITYPHEAFSRLTSRDPDRFWTSGQWMTEKGGGSDVAGGTETVAVKVGEGQYKLHGYKWFSSATDSDMTLTLARCSISPFSTLSNHSYYIKTYVYCRIADESGDTTAGTKGISMFYARIRNDDGALNGIQVAKLKNKLGTRQLPTAELLLDGTDATLVSEPGRGIASIASMLTITRMHNVTSSVSSMRKILLLARDYAKRRAAFGNKLQSHQLHLLTLSRMETEVRGCTALMVDLAAKVVDLFMHFRIELTFLNAHVRLAWMTVARSVRGTPFCCA